MACNSARIRTWTLVQTLSLSGAGASPRFGSAVALALPYLVVGAPVADSADGAGTGDVLVYQNGGTGFAPKKSITTGTNLIRKWKLFVSYAAPGTGNKDTYPHRIISTPFIGGPGSISTETYLCIGPLDSKSEAESVLSYLTCRLTRLLMSRMREFRFSITLVEDSVRSSLRGSSKDITVSVSSRPSSTEAAALG